MAYESDETGSFEVYIRPFPGPGKGTRISTDGGMHPRWRKDGQELYYVAPDWTVVSAQVTLSSPEPIVVDRKPLFRQVMASALKGLSSPYDAAPDGRHFVVLVPAGPPTPLTLVQNWTALFDR